MYKPAPDTSLSITDEEYVEAGARIVPTAADVWNQADIVTKVKEPQPSEYGFFRKA
ncbi:MAG: hypothetical protein QM757_31345 [Paludibaculum sp.]